MKITTLTQEEFNHMDKSKLYRQIETESVDDVPDWLEEKVYQYIRPDGSVIWRVEA